MQVLILSLIALAECNFSDYSGSYDYSFYGGDDTDDADLGFFSVRDGEVTTCTSGHAIDNLPGTDVTCADDEVCQVLVQYQSHPQAGSRSLYHTKCVKQDVCQANIKYNGNKCHLFSAGGRSLMAQCGGCCTGTLCNLYGPVFTPNQANVGDGNQSLFGTLTHSGSGK